MKQFNNEIEIISHPLSRKRFGWDIFGQGRRNSISISAIVMGSGMSLVMTDIGEVIGVTEPMVPGIVIGVVGMLMAIINYPIYKGILSSRRKKYAEQIIALSDKLMNQ